MPGVETNFDDIAGVQGIVDRWTSLYAATSEKHEEAAYAGIPEASRVSARGIEVGHIFYFGTKYSAPMGATVAGPDGKETHVHMGSYGIGPSRLVPAIIEASHDDAGSLADAIAPFAVSCSPQIRRAATDGAAASFMPGYGNAGVEFV